MTNGSWMIAGGLDKNVSKMNTAECTNTDSFEQGKNLPISVYDHCLVRLDDTRLFLAGGIRNENTM